MTQADPNLCPYNFAIEREAASFADLMLAIAALKWCAEAPSVDTADRDSLHRVVTWMIDGIEEAAGPSA